MALSAENHRRIDTFVLWSIVAILIYSTAILLNAFFNGTDVGSWIWERHQNQFSWYSRPLFVVLVCYYAYRQKIWHVVGALLLIATSLFWFAAPENVPEHISGYLEWEKQQFFTNESSGPFRGIVAMTADYRVSQRHGTKAINCVNDAKSAVRWIRENAKQLDRRRLK